MNAVFSNGKVKVGTESGDLVEKDVELVTLSGGYLGKDEITRQVAEDDKLVYAEGYNAFKNPPTPPKVAREGSVDAEFVVLPSPSLPASAGASPAAAAPGADAAGAPATAQPLGG